MEEYWSLEDNIKIDLKEIGVDVMNWMGLAQGRDRQWTCIKLLSYQLCKCGITQVTCLIQFYNSCTLVL